MDVISKGLKNLGYLLFDPSDAEVIEMSERLLEGRDDCERTIKGIKRALGMMRAE